MTLCASLKIHRNFSIDLVGLAAVALGVPVAGLALVTVVLAQSLATAIAVGEVEDESRVLAAAASVAGALSKSLVESTAAAAVDGALWAELVLGRDSVAKVVDGVDTAAEAVASAVVGVGVVALWESALDGGGGVSLLVGDGGHVTALDIGAGLAEALEDWLWGDLTAGALIRVGVHASEHLLGGGETGKGGDGDELHFLCLKFSGGDNLPM